METIKDNNYYMQKIAFIRNLIDIVNKNKPNTIRKQQHFDTVVQNLNDNIKVFAEKICITE